MIDIVDLETMDRAALIAAWSKLFGEPAPTGISRSFLRRFLAIEIQSRRQGRLSKATLAALSAPSDKASKFVSSRLKPGARLLREWNGVTHTVDVSEEGFVWNGQTWRSLSVIAREITGAHWSGPRFFGLTGTQSK